VEGISRGLVERIGGVFANGNIGEAACGRRVPL